MAMITPRQIVRNLNGHSTEILVQTFADRVLVLVTQMGKVGTLVLPKVLLSTFKYFNFLLY